MNKEIKTIQEIVITVGEQTLTLSESEAKKLHKQLCDIFGAKTEYVCIPYPTGGPVYVPSLPLPHRWDEPYCKAASQGLGDMQGLSKINALGGI